MAIADMLLAEFDRECRSTRRMLERYPEGKGDWKPHEKSMSLSTLAGHVSTLPNFATAIATKDRMDMNPGDHKPFHPKNATEALSRFDEEAAKARAAIGNVSDADMDKHWIFAFQGKVFLDEPRIDALRTYYFNHVVHHRGQLTVYYRLNGIPVPGMYGPSADEQM